MPLRQAVRLHAGRFGRWAIMLLEDLWDAFKEPPRCARAPTGAHDCHRESPGNHHPLRVPSPRQTYQEFPHRMGQRRQTRRSPKETEMNPCKLVPEEGLEPSQPRGPRDFESRASTSSATPAGWHSRLRPRLRRGSPKLQRRRYRRCEERSLTDALELPNQGCGGARRSVSFSEDAPFWPILL